MLGRERKHGIKYPWTARVLGSTRDLGASAVARPKGRGNICNIRRGLRSNKLINK